MRPSAPPCPPGGGSGSGRRAARSAWRSSTTPTSFGSVCRASWRWATTPPAPAGRRVAIVTNAGGPGILCADACEAAGLQVPAFSERLRSRLAAVLPAEGAAGNPVDLLAAAPPERYGRVLELVTASGEADAMIVIHIPPFAGVHGTDQIAAAAQRAAANAPAVVTMLAVLMTTADAPAELRGGSRRIPCYAFPEEAARALARAAERGQWLRHPDTPLPELPGIRHDEAAALVAHALADGPRWLTVEEAARLLGCYGLPLAEWRLAHTTEKAGEMAEELGGPVALKATAPGLLHKTEAGAVRLNLKGRQEVTRAASELAEVLTATGNPPEGFLLQRMATGVAELLVGVVHDPTFGPVVVVGAGGTSAELLGDVGVRLAPLTDRDPGELLRSLKTFPLLDRWRGAPEADLSALEDLLLRIGAFADDRPEIAELDCNPVMVGPDGAMIVDVRVRVEHPAPPLPLSARRR